MVTAITKSFIAKYVIDIQRVTIKIKTEYDKQPAPNISSSTKKTNDGNQDSLTIPLQEASYREARDNSMTATTQ